MECKGEGTTADGEDEFGNTPFEQQLEQQEVDDYGLGPTRKRRRKESEQQLKQQDKLAPGPEWLTQFVNTYRALSQIRISENGSCSRNRLLCE